MSPQRSETNLVLTGAQTSCRFGPEADSAKEAKEADLRRRLFPAFARLHQSITNPWTPVVFSWRERHLFYFPA
jgi:hypothetical protein